MSDYDIAVIGGGLAGLSLSVLLGQEGWKVICIDREDIKKQNEKLYDIRTTAISYGSRNMLKNANIWQDLESIAEPIKDILILDEDSPVELTFNSSDIDADAFGWIVDNRDLRKTLISHVQSHETVTHLTGQAVTNFDNRDDHVIVTLSNGTHINARLVVGADGRNSFTREAMSIGTWGRDYDQNAIVCLINHTKPHNGLAIEHFRSQGPFAVLPYTDDENGTPRSAVVWTVERSDNDQWMDCSDATFRTAIQTRCGDIFGEISLIGQRASWPLNFVKAYDYIGDRMCLVAEAAHGIHPIAGQGLNLSLRDIAALVETLDGAQDPGDQCLLKAYQKTRKADNIIMSLTMDGLVDLFGSNIPPVRAARRFGLQTVSKLPFIKKFFMRQAMGTVGHLPSLVRDAA
jgi:2-octaprenyl-6-methoxyphenol hydroxylase